MVDTNLYHTIIYTKDPKVMEFPLSRSILVPDITIGMGSSGGKIYSLINKHTKELENYVIKLMTIPTDLSMDTLVSNDSNLDRETTLQNLLYHLSKSFTDIIPFAYPITYIFIKSDEVSPKGRKKIEELDSDERDKVRVSEAQKEAGVIMEKCQYTFVRMMKFFQSKDKIDVFLKSIYKFIKINLQRDYKKLFEKYNFKHNDLHVENLMMNLKEDKIEFKMIDFGLSVLNVNGTILDNSKNLREHMFGSNPDALVLFTEYYETDIILLIFSILNKLQLYEKVLKEEDYASSRLLGDYIEVFCMLLERMTKLYTTSKMIKEGKLKKLTYSDQKLEKLFGEEGIKSIPSSTENEKNENIDGYYRRLTENWSINSWRELSYISLVTSKL